MFLSASSGFMFRRFIDFGLAQIIEDSEWVQDFGRRGKDYCFSPEMFANVAYDAKKADLWALCTCCYLAVTGCESHDVPIIEDSKFNQMISGDFDDFFKECFTMKPNERTSIDAILRHPFWK